jgi:uncharacterized protein
VISETVFEVTAMNNMQKILLFVKYPEPGKVKTRMESLLGKDRVAGLYQCFVLDLLETLKDAGYPLSLVFSPSERKREMVHLFGEGYDYRPQEGDGLGERMKNAFRECFAEGTEAAVLIGSDLPDLPAYVLREAFSALKSSAAVIGPSVDGGYYLIGFRKEGFSPEIFDGIPWSTDRVLSETMQRLAAAERTVSILPWGRDLDTPEDLQDFWRRNLSSAFARSRTVNYLRQFDFPATLDAGNTPSP